MNINDVVALAKAGYKVNEIKELIALEPQPQKQEEVKEEEQEPDNNFQAILDEKEAEIKRLQAEVENNKQALKQAQQINTNKTISVEGTDDLQTLSDYVKAFM